ncbi:substrate-binding periplasmic protein [Maridesulfovibrio sp. FT414]|uniref:substrate-binding periplasmic protein n=1 Tax=Maridesulfovibrio sp. FT414 TaxID=2979469 RepID=UPI003D801B16
MKFLRHILIITTAIGLIPLGFISGNSNGLAFAQKKFTIGISILDDDQTGSPTLEALLTELYHRAGADVEFMHLPLLRDLEYANRGKISASSARTLTALANYPGLKPIPTPLFTNNLCAFYPTGKKPINTPEDLDGLSSGVVRGDMSATNLASGHARQMFETNNFTQLLTMLNKGRFDAAVTNQEIGSVILERTGMDKIKTSPILMSLTLYHVVNANIGNDMMERLDNALKEMHRDGTIRRILKDYTSLLREPENDMDNGN